MAKPHRFLLDRVSSYTSEARAFVRRRRIRSLPFARARYVGGETVGFAVEEDPGARMLEQAEELLDELDALAE